MTSPFKLYVVTPSAVVKNEAAMLVSLLEAGAAAVYVRKEHYPRSLLKALQEIIPASLRKRLILPYSTLITAGVMPDVIHHVHDRDRLYLRIQSPDTTLSTSIHDMADLVFLPDQYTTAFYSPVYPSISKPGHEPFHSFADTVKKLTMFKPQRTDVEVVALGGVTVNNIQEVRESGFDGAAMLGSIWKDGDPVAHFNEFLSKIR